VKIAIVAALAIGFLLLVRRRLLQVDLSFPWFVALVALGFASLSDRFIDWAAGTLGIVYQPIGIVFLTIALLVGLITVQAIAISRLRERHIGLVRRLAQLELVVQGMQATQEEFDV
jgi:hypothetical protein